MTRLLLPTILLLLALAVPSFAVDLTLNNTPPQGYFSPMVDVPLLS